MLLLLEFLVAILLCMPSQVNGLFTVEAKCLPGYEWVFNSVNQSPCDLLAELASVCAGTQLNLTPLQAGHMYDPPTTAMANGCRCSTVVYSLMAACSYCQDRSYVSWSSYMANCKTVYVTTFNQNIPDGVKVPVYAYQNVTVGGTFDLVVAQNTRGPESTQIPPSSTPTTSTPTTSAPTTITPITVTPTSSISDRPLNKTPAIVGGVVGGLVAVGFIVALVTFILLRSRRKARLASEQMSARTSLLTSLPSGPSSVKHFGNFQDGLSHQDIVGRTQYNAGIPEL